MGEILSTERGLIGKFSTERGLMGEILLTERSDGGNSPD